MKTYIPSNGTEGSIFFASWCEKCARDAHMNSGKPLQVVIEDYLSDNELESQ